MTRIICFGDSITQGHDISPDQRWTAVLANALPGHEILNRGVSGNTTALALDRFVADVLPMIAAKTLVLLEFGLNDGDHRPGCLRPRASLGEFLSNLDELVTVCTSAGATCLLVAHHRVTTEEADQGNGLSWQANIEPYNSVIRELARARKLTCIDIADAVARHGHDATSLLHADGVHLNPAGNALYASLMQVALAPYLSGRQPLALVAAMARNRVIGNQGQLPWHEPADLAHFKRITTGHAVVMGRKTWDSLGRPLPRRRNLVVTRQAGFTAPGIEVFPTLESALAAARTTDPEPHVIGGGQIYALALPLATRIELTEIATEPEGDAWFPLLDAGWVVAAQRELGHCHFKTWIPHS